MYVIAICGPLESAALEFAKQLSREVKIPTTILHQFDYQIKEDIDFERLKKDLELQQGIVLLVGHTLYVDDALKKTLGEGLKIKLFIEAALDSCLTSFIKKRLSEDVGKSTSEYFEKVKPQNEIINVTKKYADVVIPEKEDYAVALQLLCSSMLAYHSSLEKQEQKKPTTFSLFSN
ncbi:hypothetical protein [Legionella brunensis]|uniref:Uridine/cytidine kinase n=1 Tax=Legionella brunensis TaxID=29422 RepID=A0A0W0SPG7_9GAMM|nr:hypothetical protein [Legionella brunensis]KTC85117.1 uridine/cytidine kinase [Legionella brunensis]